MNKNIEDYPINIQLRILAYEASEYSRKIYELEDDDYVDRRTITKKENALLKRLQSIQKLTGVPLDKFERFVDIGTCQTWGQYYDKFRELGIPIATDEEMNKYFGKKRGKE